MTSFEHFHAPFDFAADTLNLMARLQCETMTLMTRRTQAYIDWPKTLGRCRSAEDLMTEQVRFWQMAQRHYAEGYERAMSALPVGHGGPLVPSAPPASPRRDYIVVSERPAGAAKDAGIETVTTVPASRPTIRVRRSA